MKERRASGKRILIYLIVLLLAIVTILYLAYVLHAFGSVEPGSAFNLYTYSKLNLNATEVDIATNYTYIPIVMNENSTFMGILKSEGYEFSTTNVLNSSNKTDYNAPASIVSTVYVMQNSGVASKALQSLIDSYNSRQSIFRESYNSSNYASGNTRVNITYVTSIAVLNYTAYKAYLNTTTNNTISPLPIYQETVLFNYENILYSIIINGYIKIPSEKMGRELAIEAINNINKWR